MPVFELTELPDAIPRGAPIMGLDLGEKTIGVAISDVGLMIASPPTSSARRSSPPTPRRCSR